MSEEKEREYVYRLNLNYIYKVIYFRIVENILFLRSLVFDVVIFLLL